MENSPYFITFNFPPSKLPLKGIVVSANAFDVTFNGVTKDTLTKAKIIDDLVISFEINLK